VDKLKDSKINIGKVRTDMNSTLSLRFVAYQILLFTGMKNKIERNLFGMIPLGKSNYF
jgi:hypothetical protein